MTQVADTLPHSPLRPRHGEHADSSFSTRTSSRLWSLVWPEWKIGGLDCVPASFSEVEPFIREHYPSIFAHEPDRFLQEPMTPAKRRFLEDCDVYVFRDGGRAVGVWMGNPVDWSTYYCRTMAILPEYRERGVFGHFCVRLIAFLRESGLERLYAETSPTNLPMNRGMLAVGMVVTATVNCERWGVTLRYTKFLTEASEECFRRQFINAIHVKPRSPK